MRRFGPVLAWSVLALAQFTASARAGTDDLIFAYGFEPDTTPPVLTFVGPTGTVTTSRPTLSFSYVETGSGIDIASMTVLYVDYPLGVACGASSNMIFCSLGEDLPNGQVGLGATVRDFEGNESAVTGRIITVNAPPPP